MPVALVNLASGSKGNATCVLGAGGGVLVDCGLSRRETLRRLAAAGVDRRRIQAVLLTHEHTDHVRGAARVAAALDAPLLMTAGTARASGLGALPGARLLAPGVPVNVAGMTVLPVATSHDAAEPCAYRLADRHGAVLLATDLGTADDLPAAALAGLDTLLVEANHDPDLLRDGPYPAFLKARIAGPRGHLSNRQGGELVARVRRHSPRLSTVVLAHLSEKNNRPELALAGARAAAGATAGGLRWLVARQDRITVVEREDGACG